jgi:hypothetical protein
MGSTLHFPTNSGTHSLNLSKKSIAFTGQMPLHAPQAVQKPGVIMPFV